MSEERQVGSDRLILATGALDLAERALIGELRKARSSGKVCTIVVTVDSGGLTVRACQPPVRLRARGCTT